MQNGVCTETRYRYLFLLLAVALIISAVGAEPTYPKLTGYVNDFAGILTLAEESALSQRLGMIEQNTTAEIAIVTVAGTQGQDKVTFAAKVGDTNGVGKAATDNGIVVMWSTGDVKGGAIATGRGIEGTVTDAISSQIGRGSRSFFDQGRPADGFNYIVDGLDDVIEPQWNVPVQVGGIVDESAFTGAMTAGIIIFAAIIFGSLFLGRRSPKYEESFTDSHKSSHSRYTKHYGDDEDIVGTAIMAGALSGSFSHHDSSDDDSSSSSSGGDSGGFGGFGGGSFGGGGSGF